MKTIVGSIVRQFSFRRVLIVNGIICGLFLMANALFTPATPHWLILAALLAGGLFRSLQFTAVNTMGYADMPYTRMSLATSLSGTAQQLSVSVGRSEEHTSELQSLMRISYAVFCLKKKTHNT